MYQFGRNVLIPCSYRLRCSIAKGVIKAVYISSQATCKCYFVLIKTELRYKIYVRTLKPRLGAREIVETLYESTLT